MLTAVKNQIKVSILSIKFGLMKEMLNKVTFISNIVFMILNNATFIVEWVILYSLKDNIGGYTFKEVLLLWGMAASTYGFSHFIFESSYDLSETINYGKLDAFIVQPKNVLLQAITSKISVSSIGDIIYGYIVLLIYGFSIKLFILFTLFSILGSLIITSVSVIYGSLSFWFSKTDVIAGSMNGLMVSFATYPGGIFKGVAKILLYTIIPVGLANYLPIDTIINFNLNNMLIIIAITLFFITLAFTIFNLGLKRYSSSNLMSART